MRLAVLGASGRIGRAVVEAALDAGHEVTALVRVPARLGALAERVRLVTGTVEDPAAIDAALAGADAVISAIGPDGNRRDQVDRLRAGMRNTIAAMGTHGVERIVNLSGAGIDAPGDRKPVPDRLMTRVVRLMARYVVAAKQAEYDELAGTRLQWVAMRPSLVFDGPATGRYVMGPDELRPGARIGRADLAHAMVQQAERPTHLGHPGVFIRRV